ncbi:MAG: hypothetical protein AB7E78_13960 [Porticoccaceae bacterium]
MNKHRKFQTAAGLLLLGAALTAWGINITLGDGTNSVTCATVGNTTIAANGDINASVSTGQGCDLSGGGGGNPPPGPFTLTVTKGGSGAGTVTSNPTGIDCGTDCNESYTSGTSVSLTVTPGQGSTFGGWSGACTGTSACNLSMTTNRSVIATFNPSGGGGGDPGAGLWINGSNYVHDRPSTLSELFVPRCVPTQYNQCRLGGSQSLYDTVVAGQVWAMRIPAGTGFASQTYAFGVQRAETGETLTRFDLAISTGIGDFSVATACKKLGDVGEIRVHDPAVYTPTFGIVSCPITPGTRYYLNVRPALGKPEATLCGSGSGNACRYRITLPTGFPYQ